MLVLLDCRWHRRYLDLLMRAVQAALVISLGALPKEFTGIFADDPERIVKNW